MIVLNLDLGGRRKDYLEARGPVRAYGFDFKARHNESRKRTTLNYVPVVSKVGSCFNYVS